MNARDLDAIVETFAECDIAAYADMSTAVTFLSAGQGEPGREVLDQICALAASNLGLPGKPPVGVAPSAMAIVSDAKYVHVFKRMPDEPSEALSFRCLPGVDLSELLKSVDAVLDAAS
ncbi:MAG: hypothetical protein AAGD04_04380 [Pseudomonadota bacterium]